jgi:hypothetical protein
VTELCCLPIYRAHRRQFAVLVTALLTLDAYASPAHAQFSSRSTPSRSSTDNIQTTAPPSTVCWYGWQIWSVDGAAAGLFLGALADKSNPQLFVLSGATFTIGGPVVHVVHGQWASGISSLGLRVVAPLLGGAIGDHYDTCGAASSGGDGNGDCSAKWLTAGAAIGGVAASAIDGLLLAFDPVASSRTPPPNDSPESVAFPLLVPLRHGVWLGWSGDL